MSRVLALMSATMILGAAALTGAEAMPVAPVAGADAPAVTLVRDGCGPYGHRSNYGYCKPNGPGPGYGYGYEAPRFFGGPGPRFERRCFYRDTPYGPRRICR